MKTLLLPLLAALGLGAPAAAVPDGYAEALEALAAGRFAEAGRRLEAEPDALLRQEGWARVHLAAGDPAAGLRAAEAGLRRDGRHLGLLFQACRASLWLSAGDLAVDYAARMLATIPGDAALTPELRAAWRARAEDFRSQGLEIVARDRARNRAVGRARGTALGLLGACLAALLLLSLRG